LSDDERFRTNRQRVTQYDELKPILDEVLGRGTRQSWIDRLQAAGVPCGSVRDLAEVFADPQLSARDMVASVEHAAIGSMRLLGIPVKLSDTPGSIRTAPPTLGQHTAAVLRTELGMTDADIDALRAQGAI
jgi:crotonobetainyl-CoA:carnitine CoA-transferase CaiB-like acyl-CoA transferase